MNRGVRIVSVLLLAFTLSGCTIGVTTTPAIPAQPSAAVVAAEDAEAGSDVGNNRPHVSYDGLMVRRRVVIAIHPTADADLASLRLKMDDAATRLHLTLSTISPSVLDPAVLERLSPELTLLLPVEGTLADARRLTDAVTAEGRRLADVAEYKVVSVLVHDLRFQASSTKPVVLANAIAREGILSDALGSYTAVLGSSELDITYTGPLLSDDLVESVRVGIARRAGIKPSAVTVSPRSVTGVGVDMAKEPAPAPAVEVSAAHQHSSALPAVSASSFSSNQIVSAIVLVMLLALALVLLVIRRESTRR